MRTKLAGRIPSWHQWCRMYFAAVKEEGSFILARAARHLVEGIIQKRAPQAFVCYLLGSVCVSALPEVGVRSRVARADCRVNAI